ncbi:MAG TPA: T9SS type A sorting domain-containing protein [Bacteroidia bacterium]|jgi:hypothetical protein|nr:T9SS type A sorting domain-containing protein [Bacteroidia bacterium]
MKKITLIPGIAFVCGLIGFAPKASAQITLSQADLPSAGFTVMIDSDGTTKPSPGIANISSAQNWDFSALLNQKAKKDTFMLASATKYASVFTPAANLADSTIGGNGYNYFNISPSNFVVTGAEEIESVAGNPFQIEISLNPTFQQSALPASISSNNINSGTAYGSETISKTFSIVITKERVSITIQYKDTVDAYGTMKMPNGHTYNVLRQKHYETDIDSVLLFNSITSSWSFFERIITNKNQYDWYANNVGYILAEEDMSVTFDTINDVFWDASAPAPTGINEISINNNVNVYPNPANNRINFVTGIKQDLYLSIYDLTGREMDKIAVKNGISTLNTNAYNNGIYLYSLTDNSGNLVDRGKFIVQH